MRSDSTASDWMKADQIGKDITKLESELASLKSQLSEQKEPTAMEMIRDVFEPIQLGEDTVVNQILELASKKAGKTKASKQDDEPPKYPVSNRDFTMTDKITIDDLKADDNAREWRMMTNKAEGER